MGKRAAIGTPFASACAFAFAFALGGCGTSIGINASASRSPHTVDRALQANCARVAHFAAAAPRVAALPRGTLRPPMPAGLTGAVGRVMRPLPRDFEFTPDEASFAVGQPGSRELVIVGTIQGSVSALHAHVIASLTHAGWHPMASAADYGATVSDITGFGVSYGRGDRQGLEQTLACPGGPMRLIIEQTPPGGGPPV